MMREAARRGHIVHAGTPAELWFDSHDGLVRMQSHQLQITQQPDPWYVDQGLRDHPLNFYDGVLMRKDPPFDVEFLNATLLLSRAVAQGARVINDPQALRDHNEKLAVLEFPQYAVPTLVTRSIPGIRSFWAEHRRHHRQADRRHGWRRRFSFAARRFERRLDSRGRHTTRPAHRNGAAIHS